MELNGHTAELSNCIWNFDCSLVATGSLDHTVRLWDLRHVESAHCLAAHNDEVLDVCFDYPGRRLATASNDCTAKVWDLTGDFQLISAMTGHLDEVSKVIFYSQ